MRFDAWPQSWVDYVAVGVLILGIARGRRRGLSQELLETLQWLVMILVGGLYYRTVAQLISRGPGISEATYQIAAYLLIALLIRLAFSFLQRGLGDKIVGSDLFGRGEYYGGMVAGAIRYVCVFFFVISLLHFPHYTPEMLAEDAKKQETNYGDISFPTLGAVQQTVFKQSLSGRLAETHLGAVLLQPATPPEKTKKGETLAKRRERTLDAATGGK